jgi:Pentapeptide repeats (8 copies)
MADTPISASDSQALPPGRPHGSSGSGSRRTSAKAPQPRDRSATVAALAAVGAVITSLITLFVTTHYTNEISHREQNLTAQAQITDQYNAAVDHLGNDQLDVRSGGIYALERIMRVSKADQPTVVDILFAFVRDHAPTSCDKAPTQPAADVQAALTVLGRRNPKYDQDKVTPDLNRACLNGADLTNANLPGVNLAYTDLTCAHLHGVHLDRAKMPYTQMGDADLTSATLTHSTLTHAVLNDAFLTGADLTGATLDHVDLTRAQGRRELAVAKRIGTKLPTGSPRPSPCAK